MRPDPLARIGTVAGAAGGTFAPSLSSDARTLLVMAADGTAMIYDAPSGTRIGDPLHPRVAHLNRFHVPALFCISLTAVEPTYHSSAGTSSKTTQTACFGTLAISLMASVTRQARMLDSITADLLTAAEIQRNTLHLDPQPVDPLQVIDTVITDRYLVTISAQVEDDRQVRADPMRLEQMLSNLVGNALKYGRAPYVVRVEPDAERADRIRLSVIDAAESMRRSRAELESRREAQARIEETADATVERFRAGDLTVLDTLITESDLTNARLEVLAAERAYLSLAARLRFATGTLLDLPAAGDVRGARLAPFAQPIL